MSTCHPRSTGPNHTVVLVGREDGTFAPSLEWTGTRSGSQVLNNGDGRPDLLFNDGDGVHVELNTCQ